MGSVPPELSLDFRPTFVPKSISDFLGEVSRIGDVSEKASKLEDFVKRLEEELRKIDAFKRELPLCMTLLNDAIRALKEESIQCTAPNEAQPLLEEFIPLKKDCDRSEETKKEKDYRDKKNWMSSFQLWNTDDHPSIDCTKHNAKSETKGSEEASELGSEDPFQSCKNRVEGEGFMPFKAYSGYPVASKEEREEFPVHGLSLLTPGIKNPREESNSNGSRNGCSRSVSSSAPTANIRSVTQHQQQQAARKQRRCWSPELHRRFVNALQQLGGSQAATPKQIRELMQVDGLTNDEVKSHLQKYRLHTRRLPANNASAAPTNQSVVVLGGLWMSQDQYGESSKASSSQSGSPQGPLQLTGNTGGTSTTGGDIMEDDEDAKSEGYSWKSHIPKPGKVNV
ncbi:hypothetical protein I3843_05G049000 [Carya illinoinensis]|uniref:HTH myb-type domain-containing protein n=1 Tax=Carya illinoinensis TaxID=32201 RepID=A0A8T1QFV2_CARIL|nr:transcription factor HHO6-like [Carya illinoinensis]KAG2705486.1 hypothetical protein I3760_05G056000 [Carya illinoinensis]KAG6653151.1 hypothetical protein CIPAW_05G055200 [Carya illinoinensis]KAG6711474.1 hypothetical protein I3842_05G055500 [Carya illinoinensis]KAG7977787.1 hypothetical protein I3843_05G049000 [Carya illinoinensis]